MTDNKNLFAAILICAAVLFGWQYFVAAPQMQKEQQRRSLLAKQKGHEAQTKTAELPKEIANISAQLPRKLKMDRPRSLGASGSELHFRIIPRAIHLLASCSPEPWALPSRKAR